MSVLVQNLQTGEVIDYYRSEHVVPPASVMKLLTTGAALEILGPGFRFPTILVQSKTGSYTETCISKAAVIRPWAGKVKRAF